MRAKAGVGTALGVGVVVVGIAVAALSLRGDAALPPVTDAEARAYLAQIVAASQAHDFERLCGLNGAVLNCRRQLDMAGEDAVPADAPRIIGSRYEGEKSVDDTPTRILVVEGVDGRGAPYRTEVGVFWEERGRLKAINAVYWSNFKVTGPDDSTSPG